MAAEGSKYFRATPGYTATRSITLIILGRLDSQLKHRAAFTRHRARARGHATQTDEGRPCHVHPQRVRPRVASGTEADVLVKQARADGGAQLVCSCVQLVVDCTAVVFRKPRKQASGGHCRKGGRKRTSTTEINTLTCCLETTRKRVSRCSPAGESGRVEVFDVV